MGGTGLTLRPWGSGTSRQVRGSRLRGGTRPHLSPHPRANTPLGVSGTEATRLQEGSCCLQHSEMLPWKTGNELAGLTLG